MPSLRTLDIPSLTLPDRALGPGKAVALLAYLSAAQSRSAPRRELFTLLYSHNTPRDADAFRQLLASLRKTLPDTFVTTSDSVSLAQPLDSDRQQFLDAHHREDHQAAIALYEHEFFDPFDEPGCEGFIRWAHEERLRLRRKFELSAESLVRRHLSTGNWTAALAVASDVAERFPGLSVSLRLLVETLTLSGRGDETRTILAELGVPRQQDTPAQRRALDRLLDDVDAIARTGALTNPKRPLIARTREFRTLLECWATARTGAGGTLLVDGLTGMGKTRLLANLALRLRLDTLAVIRCAAAADQGEPELDALHHLAAAIHDRPGAAGATPQHFVALKSLAADTPSTNEIDDDAHLARLVDAFADGLRAVGEEAAVAVLIDDLDRASRTTMRVIAAVAARLRTARVLLVITSRESLGRTIEASSRYRITLGRLDADGVARLLSCATGNNDATDAAALLDETDGVPARLISALDVMDANAVAAALAASTQTASSLTRHVGPGVVSADNPVITVSRRRALWILPVGVAATALLIVTALALRKAQALAVPPESFTILTWHGDSLTREAFTIGDTDTTALTPLLDVQRTTSPWRLARVPDRVRISPDGQTLAVQAETDSLNTSDIIGVRGDSAFAIADGPRDDADPDWSPDGRLVVFSSNRWADAGNEGCDIAVRDTRGNEIWRVTDGADCDVSPRWTIDGRGLGFLRRYRERNDSSAICTLVAVGDPLRCTVVDTALQNVELIDWLSEREMLLAASHDDTFAVEALDVVTGKTRRLIAGLEMVKAELSPSRRYVACWCSSAQDAARAITLFDLTGRRPLIQRGAPLDAAFRHIAWHAVGATPFSDSTSRRDALRALHGRSMAAAAAASAQFRALATAPGDTLAAARDAMRRAAPALARALADRPLPPFTGLSTATEFSSADSLVLDESWSSIDTLRWKAFGAPRPRAGGASEGLDPGGDGSYPSGLYSREPINAARGLTLNATISVPVSLPKWQSIVILLSPVARVRSMRSWNHRTGAWDGARSAKHFETGVQYPALEGGERAGSFALFGASAPQVVPVSPAMGDGRDVALRIVYGTDSTMTVTINGASTVRRRYTPPPDGLYHVRISGHSVESAVRVRRLQVWTPRE